MHRSGQESSTLNCDPVSTTHVEEYSLNVSYISQTIHITGNPAIKKPYVQVAIVGKTKS
jgi:ABC-type iron transport system FetAB ATPase subunit